MVAKRKYPDAQREQVKKLYDLGRSPTESGKLYGTYSCSKIERMTGVDKGTVWAIGRGIR